MMGDNIWIKLRYDNELFHGELCCMGGGGGIMMEGKNKYYDIGYPDVGVTLYSTYIESDNKVNFILFMGDYGGQ